MFKKFDFISEKRADGSRKWKKTDPNGKPSIWEIYKKEQAFRNMIRNTKPIVLEKKIKGSKKQKDLDDDSM